VSEQLTDVTALRDRARADRRAYGAPMLFFGLAVAGSAPFYVEHVTPEGGDLYGLGPSPYLGSYWTVALLGGGLFTVWWQRRHGRRVGLEGRAGVAVAVAAGFLLVITVLGLLPYTNYLLWPLWVRNYLPLLVIAAGAVALARLEHDLLLWVVAALYGAAALLANTYDVENVAFRLGWDPFVAHPDQERLTPLPALVLPAVVLLAGGTVALLRGRRAR
jgi:hypothetical protein